MKSTIIILMLIICGTLKAIEKDDSLKIAKSSQCSFIRSNTFADVYEKYTGEKSGDDLIKKASDAILAQGFKICDPENNVNAEKEIFSICNGNCEKKATKGILDFGGPTTAEIDKCKRLCQAYADLIGISYSASSGAVNRYIEINPMCTKKPEPTQSCPPPAIAPVVTNPINDISDKETPTTKEEKQVATTPKNEGEMNKKVDTVPEIKSLPEKKIVPKEESAIRPEPAKEQIPVELLD